MRRGLLAILAALAVGSVAACEEELPTSLDGAGLPIDIRTFEIELPWSEFGETIESFGGFGRVGDIAGSVVAHQLGGLVEARALVSFPIFPPQLTVLDSTGTAVIDPDIRATSATLIAFLDTARIDSLSTAEFSLGALEQRWVQSSATWEAAVDSLGGMKLWDEPGAGPVRPVSQTTYSFAETADSVLLEFDSLTLALWDSTLVERSLRIDLLTPGQRMRFTRFRMRIEFASAINPDTVLTADISPFRESFVYSPIPDPPPEGRVRVGGAPAYRTVLRMTVPRILNGPPELCDIVGCPFTLTPNNVNRASLVLQSRPTEPSAYQPVDSVFLDARPVLAPEILPKSPLGSSFVGGISFAPSNFVEPGGAVLDIPITLFLQNLLFESLMDDQGEPDVRADIALLTLVEPFDIAFVEFDGAASPDPPRLRFLVTVSDSLRFR
ncbi:MAG: hypothetical protein RQ745_01495 [Longimicrobiales bacterium]|nr:hypothetical protein [Longimicrobiales bacterium]